MSHHQPISKRKRRRGDNPDAPTLAEWREDTLRMCGGNEDLLAAISAYHRASLADKVDPDQSPEPECSWTALQELPDGSMRKYACLADYDGLVAVYRIQPNGKLVRLLNWPSWIVQTDNDPGWRAHCRRVKGIDRRLVHRAPVRLESVVASLRANAVPPPTASAVIPPSASSYHCQDDETSDEEFASNLAELDDL